MSQGDQITVEDRGGGEFRVSLDIFTRDPNQVMQAVHGLLISASPTNSGQNVAPEVVRSGTLWEENTQEGESGTEAELSEEELESISEYTAITQEELARHFPTEYANLQKLNSFFYEGRVRAGDSWQPFDLKAWQEGFDSFCQNIPQEEGELIRGQYLAQRREEESGEQGFE